MWLDSTINSVDVKLCGGEIRARWECGWQKNVIAIKD